MRSDHYAMWPIRLQPAIILNDAFVLNCVNIRIINSANAILNDEFVAICCYYYDHSDIISIDVNCSNDKIGSSSSYGNWVSTNSINDESNDTISVSIRLSVSKSIFVDSISKWLL